MWPRLHSEALCSTGIVNQMQPHHTTFVRLTQALPKAANVQQKNSYKGKGSLPWPVPPAWGGLAASHKEHHMEVTTGLIQTRASCVPLYWSDYLSGGYDFQLVQQEFSCGCSHTITEVPFFSSFPREITPLAFGLVLLFLLGGSCVSWSPHHPPALFTPPCHPKGHHAPGLLITCPSFLWSKRASLDNNSVPTWFL